VVVGGLCQVAAVASGLLLDSDVDRLHGIGFLAMGLGLIGYGALTLRPGLPGRAVPLILVALPIVPLPVGELINAVTQVEGTTIVFGVLWIAFAVLLPKPAEQA
jgi:hypothetical protein